jgi:ribosomal protein S18 acetylase RimI-like enzyme
MDIRPLMPELADAYLHLFDTAFADNPWWRGCYCWYYEDPCPDDEWDPSDSAQMAHNRVRRRRQIEGGDAHGLLAMQDDAVIGWVNADRRDRYGNLRGMAASIEDDDPVVGSITCFVIHPDHRREGVASELLAACDDHLRGLGAEAAEAYPRRSPSPTGMPWTASFYKGSPAMYERAGFTTHRELEHFSVVRKDL